MLTAHRTKRLPRVMRGDFGTGPNTFSNSARNARNSSRSSTGRVDRSSSRRRNRLPTMGGRAFARGSASARFTNPLFELCLAIEEPIIVAQQIQIQLGATRGVVVRGVAQARRVGTVLVLDIDGSVSPTYGTQKGTVYSGHFACPCYRPLFVFNQDGDLKRSASAACRSARGRKPQRHRLSTR